MSSKESSESKDAVNGLAFIVAIICAIAGHAQSGWGGAIIAGIVAFGGMHLLVFAVGLLLRFIVIGLVLLVAFVILQNRYQFLEGLFR